MVPGHGVKQIRKRVIGRGLVDPLRELLNRLLACALACDSGGEHLPVVLGIAVARVERDAVLVADGGVEGGLHVVDALGHEIGLELTVGVQVVQEAVGVVGTVVEGRVWRVGVMRDAEVLPLSDVVVGGGGVIGAVGGVAGQVGDDGHGLDSNHALESQIGLVGEGAGKVVGGDLVGGIKGVLDEVRGPLLQDLVVLGEVGGVLLALCVSESHDEHVTALLKGLLFVVAERMAGGVGVMAAEVVHGVRVGVLTGLLVLEQWIKEKFQEPRIAVKQNGVEGEDDIDSLDVSVGTDLLKEEICLGWISDQLSGSERLASRERSDRKVVLASGGDGIGLELAVEV